MPSSSFALLPFSVRARTVHALKRLIYPNFVQPQCLGHGRFHDVAACLCVPYSVSYSTFSKRQTEGRKDGMQGRAAAAFWSPLKILHPWSEQQFAVTRCDCS